MRIEKNAKLWSLKITVVGLIFAYLGKSEMRDIGIAILLLCTVPLLVVIFDFLISDNLAGVHNIGIFVKHRIELPPQESQTQGILNEKFWEHLCGQCEGGSRTLYLRHLLAMVLFAIFCAAVPWLLYWYALKNNACFHSFSTWPLIISTASVLLLEGILCIGFVWKIRSVDRNLTDYFTDSSCHNDISQTG